MKKHFKIFLFAFLFLGISIHSFGQEEIDSSLMELTEFVQKNDSIEDFICYFPPMPEFPGGEKALMQFLKNNLVYPDSAEKNKIEGKVYISFLVEKDGNITNISIYDNSKFKTKILGFGLEEEALRVVKLMPNWNFRNSTSKPIEVKFVLPISFKLEK